MNELEKESLHKKATQIIEKTGRFIKDVSAPQIQAYVSQYNRYLENIATASGVFAGATVVLLFSDVEKVWWLAILGFALEIISVLAVFLVFKNSLVLDAPFIQKITKIEDEFTQYSYIATMFTRNEVDSQSFLREIRQMEGNYHEFRDMSAGRVIESSRNKELQEIGRNSWRSQLNVVTYLFFAGLIATAFSILWPALVKIFCLE